MSELPETASLLSICLHRHAGGALSAARNAKATFTLQFGRGSGMRALFDLACDGDDNGGLILALLYRSPDTSSPHWLIRPVGATCAGSNFAGSLGAVRHAMAPLIPPAVTKAHTLSSDATFNLHKSVILAIPHDLFIKGSDSKLFAAASGSRVAVPLAGSDLFIGLGWTCGSGVDLDASVLASDGAGRLARIVDYRNQQAIPGVFHQGDNTTGKGEGDDERVFLDLDAGERFRVWLNVFHR